MSVRAPGMFTNLCLVRLLLFADLPVPKFHFQLKKKNQGKVPEKVGHGTIWQMAWQLQLCRLCSILSQSTLFQPMTSRVISELYNNRDITPSFPCTFKVTESFPTIAKFLTWDTDWTIVNDCSHDKVNKTGSKGQRGHKTNLDTLLRAWLVLNAEL